MNFYLLPYYNKFAICYIPGPSGHPIDFSRMDLSPEVIEQSDVQDLDQYLPPPGMSHPLYPHQGDVSYSSCYMTSPSVNSATPSWASNYRMTSAPHLPPYMTPSSAHMAPGSAHMAPGSTHMAPGSTHMAPYDLSDHAPASRSPSLSAPSPNLTSQGHPPQTSPQNLATTDNFLTPQASDCKYRAPEDPCSVKMEQHHHHHQQQNNQGTTQPQYTKYDNQSYQSNQNLSRFVMESGSSGYNSMPGFVPPSAPGMSGTANYQYSMSMHRNSIFNPIPAAVPSEQNWERYG